MRRAIGLAFAMSSSALLGYADGVHGLSNAAIMIGFSLIGFVSSSFLYDFDTKKRQK